MPASRRSSPPNRSEPRRRKDNPRTGSRRTVFPLILQHPWRRHSSSTGKNSIQKFTKSFLSPFFFFFFFPRTLRRTFDENANSLALCRNYLGRVRRYDDDDHDCDHAKTGKKEKKRKRSIGIANEIVVIVVHRINTWKIIVSRESRAYRMIHGSSINGYAIENRKLAWRTIVAASQLEFILPSHWMEESAQARDASEKV